MIFMAFEQLEHKADLKFKVTAKDMNELFYNISEAVFFGIFGKKYSEFILKEKNVINRFFQIHFKKLKPFNEQKEFILKANNIERLIHDYIEELLYVANSEYFMFEPIEISFKELPETKSVTVKLGLRKANREDYDAEVKACSYSIDFKKTNKGYETIFILDI